MAKLATGKPANDDDQENRPHPDTTVKNVVIALVGYLGAGCTDIASRLKGYLQQDFNVHHIKASQLIEQAFPGRSPSQNTEEPDGAFRIRRTTSLQDLGDEFRNKVGNNAAVAGLSLREIARLRKSESNIQNNYVFIIDSLKHPDEVEVLRKIYRGNFRLISVFSDRHVRETRLIGKPGSKAKFQGVPKSDVMKVLDRDEADGLHRYGQQVRKTFFLGDFFLNNNASESSVQELDTGLARFVDLIFGKGIHRPSPTEVGMYYAYASALSSSCLSRQVGAAIVSSAGTVVSTGMNDVPKFGGGTYDGEGKDARCHAWEYVNDELKFVGCHKDRKNILLREQISNWIIDEYFSSIDAFRNLEEPIRTEIQRKIKEESGRLEKMPGVGDIIEFSRSIHAEMDALTSCLRSGISTDGATLYCTTYPCHNCARHLVAAGIRRVYYIEPYVKSQAIDLHSDSIGETMFDCQEKIGDQIIQTKMLVSAFTGVGPRMYQDHFMKRGELKNSAGEYEPPAGLGSLVTAISVGNVIEIESAGIKDILGNDA